MSKTIIHENFPIVVLIIVSDIHPQPHDSLLNPFFAAFYLQ